MWQWIVRGWLHRQAHDRLSKMAEDEFGGDDTSTPERIPCDIAVIFALGIETAGIEDRLEEVSRIKAHGFNVRQGYWDDLSIVIAESGPGMQRAAHAAEALIDAYRPEWVISSGFAGGLQEALRARDFLLADEVVNLEGKQLSLGLQVSKEALEATPGVHVGRLLSADRIIRSPEEKRELGEKHHALAVDMETFAVAEVCKRRRTRCLSVRIISDGVDDALPKEIEHLMQQKSITSKAGAVVGAIFNRPGSLKDMWQLKEDALTNAQRLGKFLEGVLEQLPVDSDKE